MSKSSKEERLAKLREIIGSQRTLSTSELQESLEVSRMTLQRFGYITTRGLFDRLFGSVTLSREQYNLTESQSINIEAKRRIAQYAASLIKDDDTVFFGAGVTVLEIAKILSNSTYSLTAFNIFTPIGSRSLQKRKYPTDYGWWILPCRNRIDPLDQDF